MNPQKIALARKTASENRVNPCVFHRENVFSLTYQLQKARLNDIRVTKMADNNNQNTNSEPIEFPNFSKLENVQDILDNNRQVDILSIK